ncbi:MAG: S41 family peptidase [Flavobacteriales bacterium]|nr:S41 family peptidase [Flavobacteriales bacterium]MDW8409869.1 S41 family peptidase [Flavobacteriales bacterium]
MGTICIIGLNSCKKENKVIAPKDFPNSPQGNFEAFWHGMNRYYAFWEYDPTNWDKMYTEYKDKVSDTTSEIGLYYIFKEMISGLIDHHFTLSGNINDSMNFIIGPKKVMDLSISYHYLLDSDYYEQTLFNQLDPNDREKYNGFVFGTLLGKYQFVRFPQFDVLGWAGTNPNFVLNMINFLSNPAPYHKGVIVDLRGNSGGNSDEISLLVGPFIKEPLEYGYLKVKTGPNRNEFSPWMPEKAFPSSYGFNSLPIVVLCDQLTASNGELTTMALSLLPRCTVVGTTTFGAHAALAGPSVRYLTYAGTFYLPNGWKVQTTVNVFKFKDGNIYEGKGFPPDIHIALDENLFLGLGIDNQLQKALEILPQ